MSFDAKDYNSNTNIAWILLACPDDKFRDVEQAEKLIRMEIDAEKDYLYFQVVAEIEASKEDTKKT